MKTLKIEKTITDLVYEAEDGTQFGDIEECKKYEETAKCVINSKFVHAFGEWASRNLIGTISCTDSGYSANDFEALPLNMSHSYESTWATVEIKNTEDYNTLAMWFKHNADDLYVDKILKYKPENLIGKKLVLISEYDSGTIYPLGTIEEIKRKMDINLRCFEAGVELRCRDCKHAELVKDGKGEDRIKCEFHDPLLRINCVCCGEYEDKE